MKSLKETLGAAAIYHKDGDYYSPSKLASEWKSSSRNISCVKALRKCWI